MFRGLLKIGSVYYDTGEGAVFRVNRKWAGWLLAGQ